MLKIYINTILKFCKGASLWTAKLTFSVGFPTTSGIWSEDQRQDGKNIVLALLILLCPNNLENDLSTEASSITLSHSVTEHWGFSFYPFCCTCSGQCVAGSLFTTILHFIAFFSLHGKMLPILLHALSPALRRLRSLPTKWRNQQFLWRDVYLYHTLNKQSVACIMSACVSII